jgi:hypothetical protein
MVPPAQAAVASGMTVDIVMGGQTYHYDGATGTDLGAYSDPLGQFVQDCVRVNHPQSPLSIFFRPDRGSDRVEVVCELGRLWAGTEPVNLTAYSVRIMRGPATLASFDVPYHYWRVRWRWQSTPRPVRAKASQLMDQWLMPRLNGRLVPVKETYRTPTRYEPIGLAGLMPDMGSTGERAEIGLMTEAQAQYLCNGDDAALGTLLAQADAAGSYPFTVRDEKTNAPLDVFAYPKATLYGQGGKGHGTPYFPTPTAPRDFPGYFTTGRADAAHQPAFSYLPYLLTGDPYHLEQLQLAATWSVIWRPWDYRYRTTQIRGEAWALRTWAQVAKITPANVPKWLLPQAHWQKLLDSYLNWYLKTFVASPEACRAIFRSTDMVFGDSRGKLVEGTHSQPWQEDFLASVLGWMVLMGHTQWRPVLEWKIGSTIARTNGQSGWVRAYCTPTDIVTRVNENAPWVQTWKEAWDLTASTLNITVTDPDHLDLTQLFYFPYTRGALVLAKHLEIPNIDPSVAWAERELGRTVGRKPYSYKWSLV